MIQRVQTIFLFISAALCGLLLVTNPIFAEFSYWIEGSEFQAVFLYWSSFGASIINGNGNMFLENYWLNFILLLLSAIFSFASIFMFRHAKIQITMVIASVLLIGCLGLKLLYEYSSFKNQHPGCEFEINAHLFWIVLLLALNILAVFAIHLDRRSTQRNYFGFPKG